MPHRVNPLVRLIPPSMVRFFARPYVAGDSLEKALAAAADLWSRRGLLTTLDLLAEGIETPAAVRDNVDIYLEMVDAVAEDARFESARPTLSLKPSSYAVAPPDAEGNARTAREAMFEIAERAKDKGVQLTIDMEGRAWTDFTLDVLDDLHRAGHRHVGAVLQTRLNRTQADLDRLPPRCRVRLVIGIYREPLSVAVTDKRVMKERLLEYGATLLRRGHYVELATHDEPWVRRFVDEVAPAVGADAERFEVQMLYGVPRERLLADLTGRRIRARLYVPFARSWDQAIAYLRRRLDEYPQMMLLVLRNWLRR
jgi:proline dehydrogenase